MGNEVELWNKALKGAMALPFVKIEREAFLKKELPVYCNAEALEKAISSSPLDVLGRKAYAQITHAQSHRLRFWYVATHQPLLQRRKVRH